VTHDAEQQLVRFRPYLRLLARMWWDGNLQVRQDASDLVQETLLQAHRAFAQFEGQTDAELAAWLRKILANVLAGTFRNQNRQKRDAKRERSLEDYVDQTSLRLAGWPPAVEPSPDQQAELNERAMRVAESIETLPEAQRDVIVQYFWQGRTLAESAEHLGRTPGAVAGLLHRGLKRLRRALPEFEPTILRNPEP